MSYLKHKKLYLVFTLVIICLICCSCAKNTEQNINVSEDDRTQSQPANQNKVFTGSSASPPEMLIFYNYDQYVELKESLELSDDDFNLFIKSNDFDMNGINSKEDVGTICGKIDTLPVPSAQELTLTEMTVYVDRGECLIKYKTPEDITCSCLFYFDKDEVASFNSVKNSSNYQVVSDITDNVSDVYYVNDGSKDGVEAYYIIINDFLVLFRVYDTSPSAALELLKSADFDASVTQ